MSNFKIGKVYAVDDVQVTITYSASAAHPLWLVIHAIGRVPTTGWGVGELTRYIYLQRPDDRVQEFDFNARLPDAGVATAPVLTPISSHFELPKVDIANYWGQGDRLAGVRIHAVANRKAIEVVEYQEAVRLSATTSRRATARYVEESGIEAALSFEKDIKPLFRPNDATIMQAIAGFNLHKYEDVKQHAERIIEKLKLDMPCDGLWPAVDIEKFETWKNGGMAP